MFISPLCVSSLYLLEDLNEDSPEPFLLQAIQDSTFFHRRGTPVLWSSSWPSSNPSLKSLHLFCDGVLKDLPFIPHQNTGQWNRMNFRAKPQHRPKWIRGKPAPRCQQDQDQRVNSLWRIIKEMADKQRICSKRKAVKVNWGCFSTSTLLPTLIFQKAQIFLICCKLHALIQISLGHTEEKVPSVLLAL